MTRTKWTPAMQAQAEVAAACGVSLAEIGRVLGVGVTTVRRRLIPGEAERNRERSREANRRWREANPEANRERCREAGRRWRLANPDRCRERFRRWCEANPEASRERVRRRSALKRAANGAALAPLTLSAKQRLFELWGSRCAYCNAKHAGTVDHLIPLFAGGLDEPGNLVPACRRCNSSKNASPMEAWYRRQPFFTEARLAKIRRRTTTASGQMSLAILKSTPTTAP